jgi:drug/metabolite transporter (DMT)-like permease
MQDLLGVLLIIISGISFGAAAVFARFAYEAGTNPTTLLFLRFSIASIFMLSIMWVRRLSFPRGKVLLTLVLMGALGYVGQSFCYFTALTLTSASLVALLLYLYPALVTMLAVLVLKEPVSRVKIAALILALAGTVLTIGPLGGPSGGGKIIGIVLSLGAAFIYTFYILVGSRVARQGSAIQSSTVIILSAAVVFGGAVAVKGASFPTTLSGWLSSISVAVISTVLAIVTFLAGLERVGPTTASILSAVEPAVTVIMAVLILGETLTPSRISGAMMILLAVIILARKGKIAVEDRPEAPRLWEEE